MTKMTVSITRTSTKMTIEVIITTVTVATSATRATTREAMERGGNKSHTMRDNLI